MANDPNRDVLPVKEENNVRTSKDSSERIEHQLLIKLPRSELEDRFLRLLDEQTHLKKLVNCQEEKIKRLGTKLLRIIGEKKSGKKSLDHCKETDELNLRIIELEHENYTLKDKNTVLKQQLANHSRHITVHRSPLRSSYTSPLMSVRQSAPIQNEVMYDSSNKNVETESQLRDAEMHIKELNEEIKALHNKIEYLQQDVERNSLDGRKTKVTENIELIRLQRSFKQQAIQIAALQAQVKNSENNQNLLKQELMRAQNENEEAMNLISLKQNEILTLCSKLEEKNLNKLEEAELRERINDLVKERNELKERSDFLMKTIDDKAEEAERIEELKKLLYEEKLKKEQLEVALKKSQKLLKYMEDSNKGSIEAVSCCCDNFIQVLDVSKRIEPFKERKETAVQDGLLDTDSQLLGGSTVVEEQNKELENLHKTTDASSSREKNDLTSTTDNNVKFVKCESCQEKTENCGIVAQSSEEKYCVDKMKLEREMQHLKQMLRIQTTRCEAQQTEISRLMYELKLNEEKYNGTLGRLDSYLKYFETMNYQNKKETNNFIPENLLQEDKNSLNMTQNNLPAAEESSEKSLKKPDAKENNIRRTSSTDSISGLIKSESFRITSPYAITENKTSEYDSKKRFIDQIFLESSDEEDINDEKLEKASLMKKLETLEGDAVDVEPKRKLTGRSVGDGAHLSTSLVNSSYNVSSPQNRKLSLASMSSKHQSNSDLQIQNKHAYERYKDIKSKQLKPKERDNKDVIKIAILWLQIDPSSSVGKNENINLLFVDFSFLNVKGAETETPDSLSKPKTYEEKCEFNFFKSIEITESNKETLNSLVSSPDFDLIVFKVVSEPNSEKTEDMDCEDIGVAVVTVKQFLHHCNKGPFTIAVQNMKKCKEVIGKLSVRIDATSGIFYKKN